MDEKLYKPLFAIGLVFYVAALWGALAFYEERTVFLDAAYALFHMLKENSFSIEFHRFGDAVVQFLPLMGSRLQLPLSTVMKLYSMGFVLYFLVLYLLVGFGLGRYRFALAILLVNVLFVTDTFYYTPSQLPQGMCLMILMYSLIFNRLDRVDSQRGRDSILTICVIAMSGFMAFIHPLMLFAMAYCWGYVLVSKPTRSLKTQWAYAAIAFVAVVAFKSVFLRTAYETHSLGGLKNFVTLFPHYFDTYTNRYFFGSCLGRYCWVPLVFIIDVAFCLRSGQYLKTAFIAATCIGYLFLTNTSYPDANTPHFYLENLYLPLGLFLGIPFVTDVLPKLPKRSVGVALVAAIVLTGCIRIYGNHAPYTARLAWERQAMNSYWGKKAVLGADRGRKDILMMVWGTPYEFWLLSSAERDTVASLLVDQSPNKMGWLRAENHGLYVNWYLYPYSEFPKNRYFNFPDTTSSYIFAP